MASMSPVIMYADYFPGVRSKFFIVVSSVLGYALLNISKRRGF
jgi:hypothetical protein